MASEQRRWKRQHEAFWRAHHESWKRSDLNQRQYCELHGLPQKAFENWRQRFRVEPQPPARKLLYRRGGLSHTASHSLGHMTTEPASRPIVPPARDGHRRAFSEGDKRRIVEEAMQPSANLSAVARHYGIAVRLVFRWKQELVAAAESVFVAVHVTDTDEEALS